MAIDRQGNADQPMDKYGVALPTVRHTYPLADPRYLADQLPYLFIS